MKQRIELMGTQKKLVVNRSRGIGSGENGWRVLKSTIISSIINESRACDIQHNDYS